MKSFHLIFLVLFFIGYVAGGAPWCSYSCPKDEEYSRCAGCEPTCWNQDVQNCTCKPGCVCKPGFVRNPNNYQCIPSKRCPQIKPGQCPQNERWSDHAGAIACQKRCDNSKVAYKCDHYPGCACIDKYRRNSIHGQCVPETDCRLCPPGYTYDAKTGACNFCCRECDDNEEYNECGTNCEPTCNDLGSLASQTCIAGCKKGCFCKQGYVRHPLSKKCIPQDWCPVCGMNEIWSCGNAACEKTCATLNETCTIVNIKCDEKCFCKDGFIRGFGLNETCVPISWCEEVQDESQTFLYIIKMFQSWWQSFTN